jgi:hypothetical protein
MQLLLARHQQYKQYPVCTHFNDRQQKLRPALLLKMWDVSIHESNGLIA